MNYAFSYTWLNIDEDGESIRRISKLTLLKTLRGGLQKGAINFGVSLCKLKKSVASCVMASR